MTLPLILVGASADRGHLPHLRVALIDGCVDKTQIPRSINMSVSQHPNCSETKHGVTSLRLLGDYSLPYASDSRHSSALSLYYFGISAGHDLGVDQDEVEQALANVNALAPDLLIVPIALEQRATTTRYLQQLSSSGTTILASSGNRPGLPAAFPASLDEVISVGTADDNGRPHWFNPTSGVDLYIQLSSQEPPSTSLAVVVAATKLLDIRHRYVNLDEAIQALINEQ